MITKTQFQEILDFYNLWHFNKNKQFALEKCYEVCREASESQLQQTIEEALANKRGKELSLGEIAANMRHLRSTSSAAFRDESCVCRGTGILFSRVEGTYADFSWRCDKCESETNVSYPKWSDSYLEGDKNGRKHTPLA